MKPKTIFASVTIWGLIIAAAGTIAESGDVLDQLVGQPWADRAVIIAGLVLAFFGRLRATKPVNLIGSSKLLVFAALPASVLVSSPGCVTSNARKSVLAPAVIAAWPEVEADARRGVADRVDDGEISEGVAAFRIERIDLFAESIRVLGGGSP